jgi:hypothetical protein
MKSAVRNGRRAAMMNVSTFKRSAQNDPATAGVPQQDPRR